MSCNKMGHDRRVDNLPCCACVIEELRAKNRILKLALGTAERALADIDSGFPDYRGIALQYFRWREESQEVSEVT
jgi:hypothetical protein